METKNTNTVLVLEPTPMVAGNNNAQPEILEESVGEIGTGMTITNELPEVAPVIESHSSLFGSVLFTSSVNSGAEIIELATADSVNQRERIPDEVIGLTNGGDISSSINSMVASVIGLVKEKPILNVVDLSEVGSPDNERDLGENIDSQKESVRDDSADDVLREKAPSAIVGVGLSVASSQEQTQLIVPGSEVDTVTLSEQKAYDQAFNMLKQSRYDDAAGEFAKFLRKHAGSHLTDDAWYWMAEAHYVTRDFERALIAFNTVASYFVNSPRIPASRLKIGYIQYEIADYRESRETLTKLLRDFPAHRVAVSAEARLKKMDREER
jgi:tol-pal system protein YbgF